MKTEVYLDVDEVLVGFARAAFKAHGLEGDQVPRVYPYKLWEWLEITPDEFWLPIDSAGPDWWYLLPVLPWAFDLMELVEQIDPNWEFCTTPYKGCPCSSAGRHKWMSTNAPKTNWHMTQNKARIASPGKLLIDDNDSNVDRWRERGGMAILVPRPHNKLYDYQPEPREMVGYINIQLAKLGIL